MSEYCKNCFELQNKIDELETENEQLKALCDTYRTCYQAKHSDIKCLLIKHKQTLQEIKEYLEDIDYIAQFNGTPYDLSVEIKQIITKSEEE